MAVESSERRGGLGEKGTFDLQRWVAAGPGDQFAVAAITVAKLWHGVERARGAQRLRRRQFLQAFLEKLPVIPYTEQTACEHARVWAKLEASGKMIGYDGLIVAATALERGSALASFNQKHFAQIKGLTVIEPKQAAHLLCRGPVAALRHLL